jgi:hypothetical protein
MALFVALLTMTPCLRAQDVGEDVPKSWLTADTLRVPELNFSIDSPIVGWRWTYKRLPANQNAKSTAFFVSSPDQQERYTLIVLEHTSTQFRQADANEFIGGMLKSLPKGWTPGRVQIDPVDIPVPLAAHFTTELHLPNDATLFQHGYLLPGRKTYMLVVYAAESTEPESFTRFARSFRYVDAYDNAYRPPIRAVAKNIWIILTVYLGVLLLTMVLDIMHVIRESRARRIVLATPNGLATPDVLGAVDTRPAESLALTSWSRTLLAVGSTANFFMAWLTHFDRDAAYVSGAVVGAFIWPLVIAYIAHGRKRTRNWNRFARLYFWLSVFNPAFIARNNKP